MTTQPYVELAYGPTALDLATSQRLLQPREDRTVSEALGDSLIALRAHVIREAQEQIRDIPTIDAITLTKLVDKIWALYTPRFSVLMVPFLMSTYGAAFAAANAGDVPQEYLEVLAKEYAMRMGNYYHESSKEAMVQGFQTYVNRRMARKAAADRALRAYGLTPRQMGGLTSAVQFEVKADAGINVLPERRAAKYIRDSVAQRLGILTKQEQHNLEQQAQQTVWLWLHRQGRISDTATKVWLTAKDERVCPLCGPLHGMKVPLLEKFPVGTGALWTPGVHPNCRCEVRLTQTLPVSKSLIRKDGDKWYNDEYKRTPDGRFAAEGARMELPVEERVFSVPTQVRSRSGRRDSAAMAGQEAPQLQARPERVAQLRPLDSEELRRKIREEAAEQTYAEKLVEREIQRRAQQKEEAEVPPLVLRPEQEKVQPLTVRETKIDIPVLQERIPLSTTESEQETTPLSEQLSQLQISVRPEEKPALHYGEEQEMVRPVESMYRVVDDVTPGQVEYQFGDAVFVNNYQQAVQTALALRQSKIYEDYNFYTEHDDSDVTWKFRDKFHGNVEARIEPNQWWTTLQTVAMLGTSQKWDVPDRLIEVDLYDPEVIDDETGSAMWIGAASVPASEIAAEFGILPERYDVRILHLDTVHDEAGGRGVAGHYSAAQEGIEVTGDYYAAGEHWEPAQSDRGVGVDVYTLYPNAPAKAYKDENGDWIL